MDSPADLHQAVQRGILYLCDKLDGSKGTLMVRAAIARSTRGMKEHEERKDGSGIEGQVHGRETVAHR